MPKLLFEYMYQDTCPYYKCTVFLLIYIGNRHKVGYKIITYMEINTYNLKLKMTSSILILANFTLLLKVALNTIKQTNKQTNTFFL